MPKSTQYETIRNLMVVIGFNFLEQEKRKLYPIRVEARGVAITSEGAQVKVSEIKNIGTPRNTLKGDVQAFTNKEIYEKVNELSPQLGKLVKDLVLDALDEDVSVEE